VIRVLRTDEIPDCRFCHRSFLPRDKREKRTICRIDRAGQEQLEDVKRWRRTMNDLAPPLPLLGKAGEIRSDRPLPHQTSSLPLVVANFNSEQSQPVGSRQCFCFKTSTRSNGQLLAFFCAMVGCDIKCPSSLYTAFHDKYPTQYGYTKYLRMSTSSAERKGNTTCRQSLQHGETNNHGERVYSVRAR